MTHRSDTRSQANQLEVMKMTIRDRAHEWKKISIPLHKYMYKCDDF